MVDGTDFVRGAPATDRSNDKSDNSIGCGKLR